MSLPRGKPLTDARRADARSHAARPLGARRWRLVLIATLVLAQGGCTTGLREWIGNGFKVGPEYCKPPAPVAPDWIKCDNQEIENRHIVEWWTVFDDPKLNELIQTAYRENLSLRVAGTRVLQARAQQSIAVGGLFPAIAAGIRRV